MSHALPPEDEIAAILGSSEVIAVVGASRHPEKAAHAIPAYLQEAGYRIIPVNPNGGRILGEPAVASLADVNEPIDIVDVFRPAAEAPAIAEAAIAAGASTLWLQSGIVSNEAAQRAHDANLTVVMDACLGVAHRQMKDRAPGMTSRA